MRKLICWLIGAHKMNHEAAALYLQRQPWVCARCKTTLYGWITSQVPKEPQYMRKFNCPDCEHCSASIQEHAAHWNAEHGSKTSIQVVSPGLDGSSGSTPASQDEKAEGAQTEGDLRNRSDSPGATGVNPEPSAVSSSSKDLTQTQLMRILEVALDDILKQFPVGYDCRITELAGGALATLETWKQNPGERTQTATQAAAHDFMRRIMVPLGLTQTVYPDRDKELARVEQIVLEAFEWQRRRDAAICETSRKQWESMEQTDTIAARAGEARMNAHWIRRDEFPVSTTAPAVEQPRPMVMSCPICQKPHIDKGEWATRRHHEHLCEYCGTKWDFGFYSVGIEATRPDEKGGK